MSKRYVKNDIAAKVMRECEGKCVHCGSTENLQFGHIIAFSKGGATNTANLIIECEKCNLKKGIEFLPVKHLNLKDFLKENDLDYNLLEFSEMKEKLIKKWNEYKKTEKFSLLNPFEKFEKEIFFRKTIGVWNYE